jgi:serine/threonine-protein kinase RsbW
VSRVQDGPDRKFSASRLVTPSSGIDRRGDEILKNCLTLDLDRDEGRAGGVAYPRLPSFFFQIGRWSIDPIRDCGLMTGNSGAVDQSGGSMRHSFSYEIRNQPTALQDLKQELDSTLSAKLKGFDARATALLVIDELVSNLLKYGFDGEPDQRSYLKIEFDDDWLEIELKDNGHRFNPLVHPEPISLSQGLSDRSVGGLGLYLVLKMMDETHYDWIQPWNCLRLRKKMKNTFNECEN